MKQLIKIIPLLGSDQPGEVVAAAAAITRALLAEKRDWHWLAAAVDGTATSSPVGDALLRREVGRLQNELSSLRATAQRRLDENGKLLVRVGKAEAMLAKAGIELTELKRKVVELSRERDGRARVDAAAPLRDRPSASQWAFRIARMLADDDYDAQLSDKSFEFLCSVRDQIRGGHPPTVRQLPWVEDLWEKYKAVRTRTRRSA